MCDELDTSVVTVTAIDAPQEPAEPTLFTTSPAVTALQPPHTTVKPHELDPGLCRQPSTAVDPEFWFEQINRRDAKKICANCPVLTKCAKFALDMRVTDGVFAGVALPGRRHARTLRERRQQLQELVDASADHHVAQAHDDPIARMEQAGA